MTKRIFVLNGHPAQASLNRSIAEAYTASGRAAGHDIRIAHISEVDFAIDRGRAGYQEKECLEPALAEVLENIEWAEHVVLTTPMWWGGLPAKLKGLFDRVLLPGRAFDTSRTTPMGFPAPMLEGRTARVMMTSDTPDWYLRLFFRNPMPRQIERRIFGFLGIKPARFTHFTGASYPKPGVVDRWLAEGAALGGRAA